MPSSIKLIIHEIDNIPILRFRVLTFIKLSYDYPGSAEKADVWFLPERAEE